MADVNDLYDYYYKELEMSRVAASRGFSLEYNKDFIVWVLVFIGGTFMLALLVAFSIKLFSVLLGLITLIYWCVFLVWIKSFKKGSSGSIRVLVSRNGLRLIWLNVKFEELMNFTRLKIEEEGMTPQAYYHLMIEQCREYCDEQGFSIDRLISYILISIGILTLLLSGNQDFKLNIICFIILLILSVIVLFIMMHFNLEIDRKRNRYKALIKILQRMQ